MRHGLGQQVWNDGARFTGQWDHLFKMEILLDFRWAANKAEGMGEFLHSRPRFQVTFEVSEVMATST